MAEEIVMGGSELGAAGLVEQRAGRGGRGGGPEPHRAVRRRLALWGVLALAAGAMPRWAAGAGQGLQAAATTATTALLFVALAALALFVALSLAAVLLRKGAVLSQAERVAAVTPLLLSVFSLAVLWWASGAGLAA